MAEAVLDLGTSYVRSLSPLYSVPPINSEAASLPWGGLYDINRNWKTSHCGHRDGKTIDLSLSNQKAYEKRILQRSVRDAGMVFSYVQESPSNTTVNHWHVTLR